MCDRERAKVRKGIRMKSGKWGGGHQEEEEFYDDEEFVMKKEGPSNSKGNTFRSEFSSIIVLFSKFPCKIFNLVA